MGFLKIYFSILVLCTSALASNWWMEQPYFRPADFTTYQKYNHNATLTCNTTGADLDVPFQYWIRPDMVTMGEGDEESFHTPIDGEASWEVNGNNMVITNVQERHFGFYYCVRERADDDKRHVIKKALNYQGPYFGDLWPEYEMQVIIGCAATGVYLVIQFVVILIYNYHCNKRSENEDYISEHQDGIDAFGAVDMTEANGSTAPHAYDNQSHEGLNHRIGAQNISQDTTEL